MGKNNTCSIKPMIGQNFGKWLVLSELPTRTKWGSVVYACICDCGNKRAVKGSELRRGATRSCGCLAKELLSARAKLTFTTHGQTCGRKQSGAYKSWCTMKRRCLDTNFKDYPRYGGTGVMVCNRWLDSFENFYEDMGDRPKGMSLDRRDNLGNYEPGNCRWVNHFTQMNNTQKNRLVTINGETMSVSEWARAFGIPRARISARINGLGWSPEKALFAEIYRD